MSRQVWGREEREGNKRARERRSEEGTRGMKCVEGERRW